MRRTALQKLSIAGLITVMIILIAFLLSLKKVYGYTVQTGTITFARGSLIVLSSKHLWGKDGWQWRDSEGGPPLCLPRVRTDGPVVGVTIPLWIPFVIVLVASLIAWRVGWTRSTGHCLQCAYDLTGNRSGVCPECGEALSDDGSTHARSSEENV